MSNDFSFEEYYKIFRSLFPRCFSDEVVCWIVSMSALETGFWDSSLFILNHNLFGMKFPSSRPTFAIFEKNSHSCYLKNSDSIVDLVLWFTAAGFTQNHLRDLESFRQKFLKTRYNLKIESYVQSVDSIYNMYHDRVLSYE